MILDVLPSILAAAPLGAWDVLWDILVLLAMALVLGTIAEWLGQSVIVGYLVAGTLVGPNVFSWISTQAELFNIAELGVALLLFAIGLEFSPRRLASLGSIVLKTGPIQVIVTAAIGYAAATAFGLGAREAIVVGMMIAVSSTACVLRLLADRAEIDSEHGKRALGILLIQDAAVIPMILLVSVMATGGTWNQILWKLILALFLAAALIGSFYVLFIGIAPRLLRMPAWRRNRDLPVVLGVIMAAGSAWVTHAAGLSPALGAFMAGVMLGVSPFAVQVRADTRPLTTVLVTLFFAAIGMFGDPAWVIEHWAIVASIVPAILIGKPLIIVIVSRAFGSPWRYSIATALCLAQVGEFSFVLATIAQRSVDGESLMSAETFRAMVSATIGTLLVTPYLVAAAPWVGARCERILLRRRRPKSPADLDGVLSLSGASSDGAETETQDTPSDVILIIGFGPAGQRVAEGLMVAHQGELVAVDLDPRNVEIADRYGLVAHLGDATQRDVIEHAGIYKALAVVITVPDHAATRDLIYLIRDLAPDAFIVARCRYHALHWELIYAGAHEVVDEEDQLGRRLAAVIRKQVGSSAESED